MQGKEYLSKQGEKLLEYIKKHSGEYVIWDAYLRESKEISKTTLYKWLKRFEEEGVIKRKNKRVYMSEE